MTALNNKDYGNIGEEKARQYLENQGYIILEKNFRVGRIGEVDIIAQDIDSLCFIEVKTRSNNSFGTPAEAVSRQKQSTIKTIAQIYMQRHDFFDKPVRFDIVEIIMDRKGIVNEVNLIKSAF